MNAHRSRKGNFLLLPENERYVLAQVASRRAKPESIPLDDWLLILEGRKSLIPLFYLQEIYAASVCLEWIPENERPN